MIGEDGLWKNRRLGRRMKGRADGDWIGRLRISLFGHMLGNLSQSR
jgi:hypothetical protein